MNERIRELAEQAEASVNWGDYNNHEEYNRALDEWQEKFARLIIKECANQLDDGDVNGMWVRSVLHKHFGIKE